MYVRSSACCGIKEIADIYESNKDNTEILQELCETRIGDENYPPYYFFSDTNEDNIKFEYGKSLVKYIRDNKLGNIISTIPIKNNPNSGNDLKMWVWVVNPKALIKWWKKNHTNGYDGDKDV